MKEQGISHFSLVVSIVLSLDLYSPPLSMNLSKDILHFSSDFNRSPWWDFFLHPLFLNLKCFSTAE